MQNFIQKPPFDLAAFLAEPVDATKMKRFRQRRRWLDARSAPKVEKATVAPSADEAGPAIA